MRIFTLVLLALLLTGVQAKAGKWQKLKPLKEYPTSAYKLKEGVEYLQIRAYNMGVGEKRYNTKEYRVEITMQSEALRYSSPKMVKRFTKLTPNISKQSDIRKSRFCLMSGCASSISNGFMIDSDGKMWRMNMLTDILEMTGEIDTPAEAKLVLWLNNTHRETSDKGSMKYKDKYRKTPKGYEVISQYDNSISSFGECGNFTYKMLINKKGKISNYKLLKKKPSKNGCMAVD